MDAQDAYDILDALAKEPVSELTPLQEEALRCAEESPEIAREYRMRTPFDRQIAERMCDVEIPAGLKERLLENAELELQPSAAVASTSSSVAVHPPRISRRMILGSLTGLVVTVCVLFWLLPAPKLSSAAIDESLIVLWNAEAQPFQSDFQPELPLGGWRTNRVRFEPDWNGAVVDQGTLHDLAFKRFEFLSNRRISHEGLLAVVPVSRLAAIPNNHDPFTGEAPRYLTATDGSQYAIVSWTEPELKLVYFLAVSAEEHSLKALQDALSMPSA